MKKTKATLKDIIMQIWNDGTEHITYTKSGIDGFRRRIKRAIAPAKHQKTTAKKSTNETVTMKFGPTTVADVPEATAMWRSYVYPVLLVELLYRPGFMTESLTYEVPHGLGSSMIRCMNVTDPRILAFVKHIMKSARFKPFAYKLHVYNNGSRVWHSGSVYLGGKLCSAKKVLAGKDPTEEMLRDNIRSNKIEDVVRTHAGTFAFDKAYDKIIQLP